MGRERKGEGEGGRARVKWEGFRQRKGFAAGGGDGIDQVKYFTTHFRRCARRVVLGGTGLAD